MGRLRVAGFFSVAALVGGCAATSRPLGRAVHAPLCFLRGTPAALRGCRSPDRAWSVERAFAPGRLVLTQRATGRRTVGYSSNNACCDNVTWVRPHRLFFSDDYRVFSLDPLKRKVRFIAAFDDFLVSPNGEWLAGYAAAGPREPQPAGVISLRTGKCVLVPGSGDFIGREFAFHSSTPQTGFTRMGSVIVDSASGGRVVRREYRISSLRRPCPWFTRKP